MTRILDWICTEPRYTIILVVCASVAGFWIGRAAGEL